MIFRYDGTRRGTKGDFNNGGALRKLMAEGVQKMLAQAFTEKGLGESQDLQPGAWFLPPAEESKDRRKFCRDLYFQLVGKEKATVSTHKYAEEAAKAIKELEKKIGILLRRTL